MRIVFTFFQCSHNIIESSPPAAVRAPRISVAKRIVGAELSLSFPLPRRTAPFLYPG